MARLLANGKQTFLSNLGTPLAGGTVTFYEPETSTEKDTWLDAFKISVNSNPVILDSAGRAIIYGEGAYRQIVKDSLGNTIWDEYTATVDPEEASIILYGGIAGGTGNSIVISTAPTQTDPEGKVFFFFATDTNTGIAFLTIDGIGPLEIVKDIDTGATSLIGGEIVDGNLVVVAYNSTDGAFHLVSYVPNDLILGKIQLNRLTFGASITPTALAVNTQDWNPTGLANTSWIRASASAIVRLGGLVAQTNGRVIYLQNIGTFAIQLAKEDTGSAANNRFRSSEDMILQPKDAVMLLMDGVLPGWQIVTLGNANASAGLKGLGVRNDTTTPDEKVRVTADRIVVLDPDYKAVLVTNFDVTADITTVGLNGLDTGAVAASTGYFIFIVYNPLTQASGLLFSTSMGSPTLPSGFTYKTRVGWIPTDGSSDFRPIRQRGNRAKYVVTATKDCPLIISGAAGDVGTPTWAGTSLAGFVPDSATEVLVVMKAPDDARVMVAPSNDYGNQTTTTKIPWNQDNRDTAEVSILIETYNVYYASDGSDGRLYCSGWVDDIG